MVEHFIENNLSNKKLTCIIPMRVSEDREDAIDRLNYASQDCFIPDDVAVLVVDDGSEEIFSKKIIDKCNHLGYSYIKLNTYLNEFSVGRCRNYGAMYAKSKYILMQDVDLYPYNGFYKDLMTEIIVQGMDSDAKHFLMVPYVFLTEQGAVEFASLDKNIQKQQFMHYLLQGDSARIEKFSNGTSANVYNRLWYLSRGGNSSDFEGWGYEDLECNTRMLRHLNHFPIPREWQLQKYNFNSVLEYRSWKASYRLFGDLLFNKGIVFFHIWHPVFTGGTYMDRKDRNEQLFKKKMAEFVSQGIEPDALPDMHAGKTLLMAKNAFTNSRDIQPLLGDIVYVNDALLKTPGNLKDFVADNGVDRIMFFNPYHTEDLYAIYQEARRLNVPYYVAERGALPNSVFFDKNGFLADSSSYHANMWDHELSDENRKKTIEYIRRHQNTDDALESQNERVGIETLRKKFKISKRDKILFVSLQRPSDTVTRFFTEQYGSYDEFCSSLSELATRLPAGWRLGIKKHPLEDDITNIKNAINFDDVNIKDALDLADCVLTFNSGVGILSMAWMKPTLLAGKAFYYDERINSKVSSVDETIEKLKGLEKPDYETVLRFYSYLINVFYSFGEFTTKAVKLPCGSRITATTNIKYSVIRGLNEEEIILSNRKKPLVSWNSILFDRYRYSESVISKEELLQKKNVTSIDMKKVKKAELNVPTSNSDSREVVSSLTVSNIDGRQEKEEKEGKRRLFRLFYKFKKSPKEFFSDSKHAPLKTIGKVVNR
ncbi:glycosyltransferase [Aeromonas allosaccharophila]|uniref:glycosyltransferase n=1 Tax=Aeromonas allosaccharophila TaxID=656 RepID=UPI003D26152E